MSSREQRHEGKRSPEEVKRYLIEWIAEDQAVSLTPSPKQRSGIMHQPANLNPEDIFDAIRELSQSYNISSVTTFDSDTMSSYLVAALIIVNKKQPAAE